MGEIARVAYELAAKDAAWAVLPIVMADFATGEIVYVSRFAAAIFDYEPAALLGASIELLVPDELRGGHARWRQDATTPETRLMSGGRTLRGRRRDGSTVPLLVALTSCRVLEREIGIAVVVDLTGIAPAAG